MSDIDKFDKKISENTRYYLDNYLRPDGDWGGEFTPKQRINLIKYSNVNWVTITNHIKGMEYRSFLKTPYWKAISAHSKFKAGYKCQLCNSPYKLNTHHRNYAIHGLEHANVNDLIVLCENCHSYYHGKSSQSKQKSNGILASIFIGLMFLSIFSIPFINGINADLITVEIPKEKSRSTITRQSAQNILKDSSQDLPMRSPNVIIIRQRQPINPEKG